MKQERGNTTNKVSISPFSKDQVNILAAILESLAGWHLTPRNDQKVNQEVDPISKQNTTCFNQPVELSNPNKSEEAREGEYQTQTDPVRAENTEVESISMKGSGEDLGGKERKWKRVKRGDYESWTNIIRKT